MKFVLVCLALGHILLITDNVIAGIAMVWLGGALIGFSIAKYLENKHERANQPDRKRRLAHGEKRAARSKRREDR